MAKKDAALHSTRMQGPFPIHRGPFLFGPHFLSRAQWSHLFQSLIEQVLTQANLSGKVFCQPNDRLARIEFATAEMTVDGAGRMFAVDERGSWDCVMNDDDVHWSGPIGPPKQFFRELDEPQNVSMLGSDYQNVRKFTGLLHKYMEMRFKRALEEGIAQITACVERPPAPSIAIPFQQMPYLNIDDRESPADAYLTEDLELDEAVTDDGARVYCLGVAPVHSAAVARIVAKRRGPKKRFTDADIDSAILQLLHAKGIPLHHKHWNVTRLANTVVKTLSPDGPHKSTVDKRIPPTIETYKKLLAANDFKHSTK
jgi:hypothetical protein